MPQKNTILSIHHRLNLVSAFLYRSRFIIAIIFATILLLNSSCKKLAAAAGSRSAMESLFEENILNRNFVVNLATDSGTDLTSQFTGYNFILTKNNSYYDGPITGTKAGTVYSGTWSCNEDFSKLTINITLPNTPSEFNFINRSWKFTKKAFPVMELGPWGSAEPKVLHMKRL